MNHLFVKKQNIIMIKKKKDTGPFYIPLAAQESVQRDNTVWFPMSLYKDLAQKSVQR